MATEPTAADWVPDACTLPVVERSLRLAEFDEFFRTAVQRTTRPRPTGLDLVISPASEVIARGLAQRETGCCSFFRFDFDSTKDGLVMRIGVPDSQVEVLDAVQARIAGTGSVKDHV
jgi:hypothetical protein